ncbi:MAG: alpha/beta fold hydrolase [Candidatus Thiodiazotropha sp. L084R]
MKWLAVLFLSLVTLSARADVVVMVHGYLGSATSWERSGISNSLHRAGWQQAGVLTARGLLPLSDATGKNKFYTVELPSIQPIMVQARVLRDMLNAIGQRHPHEELILIGHSAGGVVARTALVMGGIPKTKSLITIASPHLGTLRAVEALDKTDDMFPFSTVKSLLVGEVYDVVRDSWGVLLDLTPERPGNLLFWLNRQPHPEIHYLSVVRPGPVGMGDELVPAISQDMNNVTALKGKVQIRQSPLSHTLHPLDGELLTDILEAL